MMAVSGLVAALALASVAAGQTTPLTGRHIEIPRWCGKAYQKGQPNFDPGGMVSPPAYHDKDLLNLKITPRHSIYVDSEVYGEFVVDAGISRAHGQPFNRCGSTLSFQVRDESTRSVLVSDKVASGTTGNVFRFPFKNLKSSLKPRAITLSVGTKCWDKKYTAKTELYYLPAKTTGSMVKIDNLNGGMLFANHLTNFRFKPILPFGFYTSCSGYLTSFDNTSQYKDLGFTGMNPVCDLNDGPNPLFDWLDRLDIPFQYDMRNSYYNLTSVAEQVPKIKDRSSLLSWYTADEPDGWQYSFFGVTAAYEYLRKVDPYHPTGLVLNCQNYHFDEYSRGADYIMEDAYPIGISPTFSKWGTPVNRTYGDCGCDNCGGALRDVADRLDSLDAYQAWLGRGKKPLWAVTQAFSGEGYWARPPTTQEAWAMNLLAFNHRAKGIMSWLFPASETLNRAHSAMAKVFAVDPIRGFILGGWPTKVKVVNQPMLDVAYWKVGKQVMVGLVNQDSSDSRAMIKIPLPGPVSSVASQPWGKLSWTVNGGALHVKGLPGVATSVVILNLG